MSIHDDLRKRLVDAHEAGACLVGDSPSDERRLRAACARGDVISPFRRVYADPQLWRDLKPTVRELHRLRAVSQLHPDWVFCDVSAALLHGFAVSNALLGRIHIMTDRKCHSRSSRDVARHVIRGDEPTKAEGIRVASIARTAFDCLRTYRFRYSLSIGDSVLRLAKMEREQLVEQLGAMHTSHRGVLRAQDIASLCDARAESGGESIARAVMIEQGYMMPALQVEVPNLFTQGEPYRLDFYWDLGQVRVGGELDGHEKYRNPQMTGGRDVVEVLADERLRESRISATGVRVMRFSHEDVVKVKRFRTILDVFGIPSGFAVPEVACT